MSMMTFLLVFTTVAVVAIALEAEAKVVDKKGIDLEAKLK